MIIIKINVFFNFKLMLNRFSRFTQFGPIPLSLVFFSHSRARDIFFQVEINNFSVKIAIARGLVAA